MQAELVEIMDSYFMDVHSELGKISKAIEFPKDYIIDENKSVKWNREEVEKHNSEVRDIEKFREQQEAELITKLRSNVQRYIAAYLKITMAKAKLIEEKAWEIRQGSTFNYFESVEEITEVIKEILDT